MPLQVMSRRSATEHDDPQTGTAEIAGPTTGAYLAIHRAHIVIHQEYGRVLEAVVDPAFGEANHARF